MNLKYYALLSIFLMLNTMAFGQIENITIDEHTTVYKLYAGLYSRLRASTDSTSFEDKVSFRIAARVTQKFSNVFSINAQAALQLENDEDILPIIDYAFITQVSKKLQLRLGSFATPNTLLRPNPITWQGHTETYGQSRITGGIPGGLLAYTFNETQNLNVGYHYQNEQWASHAMFASGNVAVAGWVQNDGEYFGQLDFENEKFTATLNYGSIFNEWASTVFYNLSQRYSIYTDVNYRTITKESEVFRLGGRSYFGNKKLHIKGFLAVQYDFASDLASAELFIHLN